jgi:hypothetical protein
VKWEKENRTPGDDAICGVGTILPLTSAEQIAKLPGYLEGFGQLLLFLETIPQAYNMLCVSVAGFPHIQLGCFGIFGWEKIRDQGYGVVERL